MAAKSNGFPVCAPLVMISEGIVQYQLGGMCGDFPSLSPMRPMFETVRFGPRKNGALLWADAEHARRGHMAIHEWACELRQN